MMALVMTSADKATGGVQHPTSDHAPHDGVDSGQIRDVHEERRNKRRDAQSQVGAYVPGERQMQIAGTAAQNQQLDTVDCRTEGARKEHRQEVDRSWHVTSQPINRPP